MYNFCEAASLITSHLYSGVKTIVLRVIDSSFLRMKSKEKLNVEYLEIDLILLQNPENFLYQDWISNSGIQFSE